MSNGFPDGPDPKDAPAPRPASPPPAAPAAPPPMPPRAADPSSDRPRPGAPPPARPGPPRPAGGGQNRSDRGPRKGPGGPPESFGNPGSRPMPVRDAVPTPSREPLRPIELPHRAFSAAGDEWIAREGGMTAAGNGGPRAPLLLLVFARAAEPERSLREHLLAGRRLADLSDDELADALAAARPFREERDRREVFPDTRKRGGKGL